MIINNVGLLVAAPIKDMLDYKAKEHGVSSGLSEAGYDIRLAQDIRFYAPKKSVSRFLGRESWSQPLIHIRNSESGRMQYIQSRFTLAHAMEEFNMPTNMVGKVHDKSTWARQGISVFNTVIEPGWEGFLTLEIVFHGNKDVFIPAGSGIAQVLFFQLAEHSRYDGKYQHQENRPVESKFR